MGNIAGAGLAFSMRCEHERQMHSLMFIRPLIFGPVFKTEYLTL